MGVPTEVLDYMGGYINAGYYLGCFPYKWDKKQKKIEFKGLAKHPSLYVHLFQCAMLVLYECFVIIRCIQTLQKKEATVQQQIGLVYKLVGYFILCYFQLGEVFHYGRLHHFVNNFIGITKEFNDIQREGKSITQEEKRSNRNAIRTMRSIKFVWFLFGTTYLPACLLKPNTPEFVTSLTANPRKLPIWVRLLAGVFHGNTTAFAAGGLSIQSIICISYMQVALQMVRKLMSPHVALVDIPMRYHQLAVLHTCFNAIFQTWAFWLENLLVFLVTVNLLQAVLFDNIRALVVALLLLFGLGYIYRKLGTMFLSTEAMLKCWLRLIGDEMRNGSNSTTAKVQQEELKRAWLIKTHKSFRPQKVMIGTFYYADRGLVLTLLGIVLNNTISLESRSAAARNRVLEQGIKEDFDFNRQINLNYELENPDP